MHRRPPPPVVGSAPARDRTERLRAFLTARLSEDLARVWARDEAQEHPGPRPGMAAQVEVLDDLLTTLAADRLPAGPELRILLWGYGSHPDHDPSWTELA